MQKKQRETTSDFKTPLLGFAVVFCSIICFVIALEVLAFLIRMISG